MKIANLIKNIKEHIGIKALATGSFIILILLAFAYLTLTSYSDKSIVPISNMGNWRVSNMSMMTALIPLVIGLLVLFSSVLLLSNNTTIRGTVLSINLVASIMLVTGIFSPWMNCAGITGGRFEENMGTKSKPVLVNALGCASSEDPYSTTPTTSQTTKSIAIYYAFTVEGDGLVSVCAYYDAGLLTTNKISRTMPAVIIGSLNGGTEPATEDPELYDDDGNANFYLFGMGTVPDATYCGGTGYLVTASLHAERFNYIFIRAQASCPSGAVGYAMNPIMSYEKNKAAYQR